MEYKKDLKGVKDTPKKSAFLYDDNAPERRKYTLFIWFIDGYDQEKTFEFITGQENVRSFIVENADVIDFTKSLISSWKERPEDKNGFVLVYDFMIYLERLLYENEDGTREKVYDDGFNMKDFLDSQHQLIELGEEESENYMNDVSLAYHRTKMIDINHMEEGEDL